VAEVVADLMAGTTWITTMNIYTNMNLDPRGEARADDSKVMRCSY